MSKSQLKYTLKQELRKVNEVIDKKIVRGLPYNKEARYHKVLLARLSVINRSSFLSRMKMVSAFMVF